MSSSNSEKDHNSGGTKKFLASVFKSPAADAYNKVLADTVNQAEADTSSIDSNLKGTTLSDKEKVKRLVEKRDAQSPSGSFVLGTYKPLAASQGYGYYYSAKVATGK